MAQSQQCLCGDAVASRQGVVMRWLGPLDQRFVIVGGEEKTTRFPILELVEEYVGQGQSKIQVAVAPAALQQGSPPPLTRR